MRKGRFVFFLIFLIFFCSLNVFSRQPKKIVAVIDFENKAGFRSWVSLGEDLADMLSHALVNSGKFIVVERPKLKAILKEQELKSKGITRGRISLGKLLNAQVLITGAVTEFEEKESGGMGGFRIKGFKIGLGKKWAHVGLIIRGIDVNTGEILFSEKVEGKSDATGFDISYDEADFGIKTQTFKKTPLGKALQDAIEKCVELIEIKTASLPWQGKVIKTSQDTVYITGGENAGLNIGDRFLVLRAQAPLTDPDTGRILGFETQEIGKIEIYKVEDKFSRARALDGNSRKFKRGDIIKLIKSEEVD